MHKHRSGVRRPRNVKITLYSFLENRWSEKFPTAKTLETREKRRSLSMTIGYRLCVCACACARALTHVRLSQKTMDTPHCFLFYLFHHLKPDPRLFEEEEPAASFALCCLVTSHIIGNRLTYDLPATNESRSRSLCKLVSTKPDLIFFFSCLHGCCFFYYMKMLLFSLMCFLHF